MIINGKEARTPKQCTPGVIEIVDVNRADDLIESSVTMRYTMHPLVQYVLRQWELSALNNATWKGTIRADRVFFFAQQLLEVCPLTVPEDLVAGSARFGEANPNVLTSSRTKVREWAEQFTEDHPRPLCNEEEMQLVGYTEREGMHHLFHNRRYDAAFCRNGAYENPWQHGYLTFNFTPSQKRNHVTVWVKARTSEQMGAGDILNVKRPAAVSGSTFDAYTVPAMLANIDEKNVLWTDSTGEFDALVDELVEHVFLVVSPNAPGLVDVWVGHNHDLSTAAQRGPRRRTRTMLGITGNQETMLELRSKVSLKDLADAELGTDNVLYAPELSDAFNMVLSTPFKNKDLDPSQQRVAGVHLATQRGFLNAAETGDGKTVTTLAVYEHKATQNADWTGLVVCEAVVREQWANEAAKWLPSAEVFVLNSRKNTDELIDFMSNRTGPVLIITSYSLAGDAWIDPEDETAELSPTGQALVSIEYDDMCVDEGLCLRRNGPTKHALRVLRDHAQVGVVLTATPYNTSKNDFARLISFARNDYRMFHGVDLDAEYDLNQPADLDMWTKIMYPYVQRDTVVNRDQFPDTETEVVYLNPTVDELELSSAITNSLQEILENLIAQSEKLARSNAGNREYEEAAEQMRTLRGTAMGSVTLARQAASDPQCIMESDTFGGALIRNYTTAVERIMEPTKRKEALRLIAHHVPKGDQVIVFTEFRVAGQKLYDELVEQGYRVGSAFGGGGRARADAITAFQNRELDVIVATGAAKRGVNLFGNVMIHLDLAYTPEVLLQRNGRSIRRFSPYDSVKFYYLVLNGTIDLKVTGIVAARVAESLLTSDAVSSEDMNLSRTALSVQSFLEQVDTSLEMPKGGDKTVALVRSLLAA